jgi:hypothetical protein
VGQKNNNMNLLHINNWQIFLTNHQHDKLEKLEEKQRNFLISKFLTTGEENKIEIAQIAINIFIMIRNFKADYKLNFERLFTKLLHSPLSELKNVIVKISKITEKGFHTQLLIDAGSFTKNHSDIKELVEIINHFYENKLPILLNEKLAASSLETEKKVIYEKIMASESYFEFSKLILRLLKCLSGLEIQNFNHFLYQINNQHFAMFSELEKLQISKIFCSLSFCENSHENLSKEDIEDFINLFRLIKHHGGDEVLEFCIITLSRTYDCSFQIIIRGLNLIVSHLESENFFNDFDKWQAENLLWSIFVTQASEQLRKPGLDNSYFLEDMGIRFERFKNDPTLKKALSSSDLTLIFSQYDTINEFCKKYNKLTFVELTNRAHEIRQLFKKNKSSEFHRLELIAISRLAIHLEFHIYPYSTQVLALLGLLVDGKHRQAQVKTGEGKSTIIAMFAFTMAMECRAVDIITSARALAIRDYEKFASFFLKCGISSGHICHDQKIPKFFSSQILYAPAFDFEFAWMEDLLWGKKLFEERLKNPIISRNFDAVCVDESDNLLIDSLKNGARLSYPADNSFNWIYNHIMCFAKKHDVQNKEFEISCLRDYLKKTLINQKNLNLKKYLMINFEYGCILQKTP